MINTLHVSAPAIHCGGCAQSIQRSLGKLPGVQSVQVDVEAKTVSVAYESANVTEAAIRERLTLAGFPPA